MDRTSEQNWQPLRVMIVDDIASNRKILEYTLKKLGIRKITSCGSGAEAIVTALTGDFDIILMDLHMPDMSGFAATEQILKNSHEKRPWIVAQSADETMDAKDRTEKIGFDDYLTKPIRPHLLKNCIEKLVTQVV